ncbi:PAS domain-containing protein [Martelella lutilitoris]|uniref:PAS domain-containing protein n=1 Tax=Martelella lutilitoris TaxID=2583532 RepID=UPI0016512BF8|nr:PAS domain-containing protein [Martelella lutilitoris]
MVQTLNRAPECILLVDPNGTIEIANAAALSLLRADEADVCGTALTSWFSRADGQEIDRAMTRVLSDEPGSRLEEVSAEFAVGPQGRSQLSLARMRHRDAVCVVISRPAAQQERPRRTAAMPRVSESELDRRSETASPVRTARPRAQQAEANPSHLGTINGHMPWNPGRSRPEKAPARPHRIIANGFFSASVPEEEPLDDLKEARFSKASPDMTKPSLAEEQKIRNADSANKPERAPATNVAPVSAASALRRDIFAEFESERDRKEREQDIPLISPAKCLLDSLERHRGEAVAESVMLTTAIDDGGLGYPLDEELLTTLFSHLVERLIAVSPPYCDARVTLKPSESDGFRAEFSDIGRGLSESELEAVFKQPELTMGISHTCLVEAQDAASRLGLKFSIRTAIESGTTVEVTFID